MRRSIEAGQRREVAQAQQAQAEQNRRRIVNEQVLSSRDDLIRTALAS